MQLELPEPATIDRIVWGRDREGKFTDRLATRYRIEVAMEPGEWQVVAVVGRSRRTPSTKLAGLRR